MCVFVVILFWVLGLEPRASHILNKHSITTFRPTIQVFLFFRQGLSIPDWPGNQRSTGRCLPSASIKGIHHFSWVVVVHTFNPSTQEAEAVDFILSSVAANLIERRPRSLPVSLLYLIFWAQQTLPCLSAKTISYN